MSALGGEVDLTKMQTKSTKLADLWLLQEGEGGSMIKKFVDVSNQCPLNQSDGMLELAVCNG